MKKAKKLPITIKAAIIGAVIGGIFLTFSTILPYIIEHKKEKEVDIDNENTIIYRQLEYYEDDGTGFLNVKNMLKIDGDVNIVKSGYIDLVGDGKFEEYFIIYNEFPNTYNYDSFCYFVLTSKRYGRLELLFYDKTFTLEAFDVVFFSRDNIPQVMIYTIGGSGHFLYFSIYEYDKFSKLDLLYHADPLERGWYYFINEKMFITDSSRHYTVEYKNGYMVSEYNDEIPIPNDFSATKIISFTNDLELKIFLNNKEIFFNEIRKDVYETRENIELVKNDILLINSNILKGNPISFKVLYSSNDPIESISGYYSKLIFKDKGIYSISFRYDYIWYYLNFNVK